ncbi:MAG: CHAT domain-containing protein [Cyanobacteria bacterium J06634_5]
MASYFRWFQRRFRWVIVFFCAFLLCVVGPSLSGQVGKAQNMVQNTAQNTVPNTVQSLANEGVTLYEAGDFAAAIAQWETALAQLSPEAPSADRATLLENLARLHRRLGQGSTALTYWSQAVEMAEAMGEPMQLGRLMSEQAQTYAQLGQYRRAIALLCGAHAVASCQDRSAIALAQATNDTVGSAAALGSFGEALRLQRDYESAIAALNQSLTVSKSLDQSGYPSAYQSAALYSLGTVYTRKAQAQYRRIDFATAVEDDRNAALLQAKAIEFDRAAQQSFEESLTLAQQQGDVDSQWRVQLSLIPLYRRLDEPDRAASAQQAAQSLLPQVSASHEKVNGTLTLANLIQFDNKTDAHTLFSQCFSGGGNPQAQALLTNAIEQAQRLQDSRGESFALGTLGHWYECQGDLARAGALTQQAEVAADQQLQGRDSLYLWQWQTGRLLHRQNQIDGAKAAYQQAVDTLETIRNELLVSDRELQFDFRDTVEPVYRELMALQLAEVGPPRAKQAAPLPPEVTLGAAITTLESLKLAELQNYFGSDCEIVPFAETQRGLTGENSGTAVITSITFDDRTAVIGSFPSGDRQIAWISETAQTIRKDVNAFRRQLEDYYDPTEFDTGRAEKIYDWLIRPFDSQLASEQIDTLVFVSDGIVRSIPMSALHDGEQFLVERYATATVPTLSLTASSQLNRSRINMLIMGLTEPATVGETSYDELQYVDQEISAIQTVVAGTTVLRNQAFTEQSLTQALGENAYSVLHMATHAQFGVDPEDTFLVTGQSEKLTFGEMDRLIRSVSANDEPIELLALTACETAIGDDRAALGIGGVVIRAGAKSAIASLWAVNDAVTAQISGQFYENLVNGQMGKAKALQAAQIEMIQSGARPSGWSPLIVVGNWQ